MVVSWVYSIDRIGRYPWQTVSSAKTDIPALGQKKAIAKAAADLIRDGDTMFINSGTTAQEQLSQFQANWAILSKLGRAGFIRVCECSAALMLITNDYLHSMVTDQLAECGMQIIETPL